MEEQLWTSSFDDLLNDFDTILKQEQGSNSSNVTNESDNSNSSNKLDEEVPSNSKDIICKYCKGINTILNDDGLNICTECGECHEYIIDAGVEWRLYKDNDSKSSDPTRCGMPINNMLEDLSYSTSIAKKNGSYFNQTMNNIYKHQIYISSDNYKSRTLLKTFNEMQNKALKAGIPESILEDAKLLYRKVREIKISRGINKEAIIVICLFLACNIQGHHINIKEISKIFNIKQNIMTQARKKLYIILNYVKDYNIIEKIKVTDPLDFVPKYCSLLNLNEDYINLVKIIVMKSVQLPNISENTPPAITAGVIYLVSYICKLNITKKDIASVSNISDVTITKCFKKIYNYINILLSDQLKDLFNIQIKYNIK